MTKKHLLCSALALLWCVGTLQAARIDTLWVESPSMHKPVQVLTIVPDCALGQKAVACPVIYLLHGYSGNAFSWYQLKPELPAIADEKGIIFVCPDGKNSWYWDSPRDSTYRYETFVASELVNYTDAHYKTIATPRGRAVTGLSMGGHGGLWLGMRHFDIFGAAGSTSGGVDIRPFPTNWQMSKQLGEFAANKGLWDKHTVMTQLSRIKEGDLALIFDCGTGDFFYEVNKTLHEQLLGRGISHDFIVRPGVHNQKYWNNAIDYQILFFEKFFKRK
ncbi:MAG: esterase family protein [Prevotellaceae bacterium]|jgi:S-formylglutathione hydrolase FrmB|nr:esterase family protein [Prevotellaceae bacterium]